MNNFSKVIQIFKIRYDKRRNRKTFGSRTILP